jgi:hypothetical protein
VKTIPAQELVSFVESSERGTLITIGGDVGQQVNGDQTVTAPMSFNVGGKSKKG